MTPRRTPPAFQVACMAAAALMAGCSLGVQGTGTAVPPVSSDLMEPSPNVVRASPAQEPPASVVFEPSIVTIVGSAPEQLLSWLGEPEWQWDQGTRSMWQYRSADCVLDIFLSPQNSVQATTTPQAVHFEWRPRRPAILKTRMDTVRPACDRMPIGAAWFDTEQGVLAVPSATPT